MYCSDQQIRFTRFFSLFNAKTGYGHLDTAKSLDNYLSLNKSGVQNFEILRSRSTFSRSWSGVGVKNFRLRTPLLATPCQFFVVGGPLHLTLCTNYKTCI